MHDDLLQPSLADRAAATGTARPWRLLSQFYVAALGGALAVTAIALINARRLQLTSAQQTVIALAGTAGLGATLAIAAILGQTAEQRWLVRVAAVAAWGGMYAVQRSADRIYGFHEGDEGYGSMWIPGTIAAVAGGLMQWPLVVAVAGGLA